MRRLIINADDFGLTTGVNRAILQAHDAGMVTSATLMAAGARSHDAVRLALSSNWLSIGCHIVLVDGTAVLDLHTIPSLAISPVNDRAAFYSSLSAFAARALVRRIDPAHIEAEAIAQIRKLQTAGLTVSHVDTHKHTHMFPGVLAPVLEAARACGVGAIRNPFEPRRPFSFRVLRKYPSLLKRYFQVQLLRRSLARTFRRAVADAGLMAPDGSLGVIATGYLNRDLLDSIIEAVPEGIWELVCHPGYEDEELGAANTRLRASRRQELELLLSPATRNLLSHHGIELISYREFAASAAR